MLTLLTPTVPERVPLLAELEASIAAQTVPVEHLVMVDGMREGPAEIRNRLAEAVTTDWLCCVDDDDLLDPTFAETLTAHLTDQVDVVWPLARIDGAKVWFDGIYVFDPDLLRSENYIPVTAAIRTSVFREVGGFRTIDGFEDWDLWLRILDHGGRFASTGPQRLWTYRWGPWARRSTEAA
jgi:hypothetical protein